MIRSFVFSEGKLVASDLEAEAMRLVRADKGLHLWVDLDNPTDEERKLVLENVFQYHPLAIEDCVTPSSLPKIEDYEDYLFIVTHAIDPSQTERFTTTELDLFLGKEYLVTFHRKPLRSIQWLADRCTKGSGVIARGTDRLAHDNIDQLIERYTPVLDGLRSKIELIEARAVEVVGVVQEGVEVLDQFHSSTRLQRTLPAVRSSLTNWSAPAFICSSIRLRKRL